MNHRDAVTTETATDAGELRGSRLIPNLVLFELPHAIAAASSSPCCFFSVSTNHLRTSSGDCDNKDSSERKEVIDELLGGADAIAAGTIKARRRHESRPTGSQFVSHPFHQYVVPLDPSVCSVHPMNPSYVPSAEKFGPTECPTIRGDVSYSNDLLVRVVMKRRVSTTTKFRVKRVRNDDGTYTQQRIACSVEKHLVGAPGVAEGFAAARGSDDDNETDDKHGGGARHHRQIPFKTEVVGVISRTVEFPHPVDFVYSTQSHCTDDAQQQQQQQQQQSQPSASPQEPKNYPPGLIPPRDYSCSPHASSIGHCHGEQRESGRKSLSFPPRHFVGPTQRPTAQYFYRNLMERRYFSMLSASEATELLRKLESEQLLTTKADEFARAIKRLRITPVVVHDPVSVPALRPRTYEIFAEEVFTIAERFAIDEALRIRPIWTKGQLFLFLSDDGRIRGSELLNILIRVSTYSVQRGAFNRLLIRFGIDPSSSFECAALQRMSARFPRTAAAWIRFLSKLDELPQILSKAEASAESSISMRRTSDPSILACKPVGVQAIFRKMLVEGQVSTSFQAVDFDDDEFHRILRAGVRILPPQVEEVCVPPGCKEDRVGGSSIRSRAQTCDIMSKSGWYSSSAVTGAMNYFTESFNAWLRDHVIPHVPRHFAVPKSSFAHSLITSVTQPLQAAQGLPYVGDLSHEFNFDAVQEDSVAHAFLADAGNAEGGENGSEDFDDSLALDDDDGMDEPSDSDGSEEYHL